MESTITFASDDYTRKGRETNVNSIWDGSELEQKVTMLADGSYVVIWRTNQTVDSGFSFEIKGQVFAADGTRIGQEFFVNTERENNQTLPDVTALASGGFAVTWQSDEVVFSRREYGVKLQLFASDGSPVGNEIEVVDKRSNSQSAPQIIELDGGGLAVLYNEADRAYVQLLQSDGSLDGARIQLNTGGRTPSNQTLVPLDTGGFAISYGVQFAAGDNDGGAVVVSIYGADGTVVSSAQRVNSITTSTQREPDITVLADGGMVITWLDFSGTTDTRTPAIRAQILEADGTPRGSEILVNNSLTSSEFSPNVVALTGGSFAIAWQDNTPGADDTDGAAIRAQVFDANGNEVGAELLVNTTTTSSQANPIMAALDDGTFVVAWEDFSDLLIKAQVIRADGAKIGGEIIVGESTFDTSRDASIAALQNGEFVVSWNRAFGQPSGDQTNGIAAQVIAGGLQATEDVALDLKGEIIVDDPDNPADMQVVLSVDHGTLTVTAGTSGALVTDSGTASVTITGSLSQIKALLETDGTSTVRYATDTDAPPSSADLSVSVTDITNSEAAVDASKAIGIIQVDDAGTVEIGTPEPFAGEDRVNTSTTNSQIQPAVTALAGGGYVVTWASVHSGTDFDVYSQLYAADGTKIGGETLVNLFMGGDQAEVSIAAMTDGGYVISWSSGGNVLARRFDSDGDPVTGEFRANTTALNTQGISNIAELADGGFLVTWSSLNQDFSGWGVYGQRFASNGTLVDGEFRVNSTTTNSQFFSQSAGLADGSYVVTWQSQSGSDTSAFGIYAQRYNADGTRAGGETLVNTTTDSIQNATSIAALPDGGYVIVWQSFNTSDSTWDVFGQIYDAAGSTRGGEFQINAESFATNAYPSVEALPDGGFIVVFANDIDSAGDQGIAGQRFDANGNKIGGEFEINETVVAQQLFSNSPREAVTVLQDGTVVTIWQGVGSGDSNGVFARQFDIPSLSATEQDPLDLKGTITVDDPDNPDAVSVVISVPTGTITATAGSSGAIVEGSGTNEVTLRGTLAEVVALLETDPTSTITYTATDVATPSVEDITVAFTDRTSGSAEISASAPIGIEDKIKILGNTFIGSAPSQVLISSSSDTPSVRETVELADGGTLFITLRGSFERGYKVEADGSIAAGTFGIEFGTSYYGAEALAGGGYVGFYAVRSGGTFPTTRYYFRSYDEDGQLVTTVETRRFPDGFTGLSDGNFVIVNQGFGEGQIYQADGTAVGSAFAIGTSGNTKLYHTVESIDGGGFVVVWTEFNGDGYILAQKYTDAGVKVGSEIVVTPNDGVTSQIDPIAHALEGGGFAVVYEENGIIGVRTVDASGVPGSPGVSIDFPSSSASLLQFLALDDGGFAIAWNKDVDPTFETDNDAFVQVFNADGTVRAGPITLGDSTLNQQFITDLETTNTGGFVAVWNDLSETGDDTSGYAVRAQSFDANGNEVGRELLLADQTLSSQTNASVAALQDGRLAVMYTDLSSTNNRALAYRLLDPALGAIEQVATDLKGLIAVNDADDPASVEVVLTVADGVLDVTAGTSGATVVGTGTMQVTITGSQAQVNALLGSDATSTVTFTPDRDDPPETIQLTVAFTDVTNGDAQVTETEQLQIALVNDAIEDSDSVLESAATATDVRANDTDVDGLAYMAIDGQLVMLGDTVQIASGALVTLELDGTLTYDANDQFNDLISAAKAAATGGVNTTATDSYTYTLRGGDTTTVTVTIDGEDSPDDIIRGDSGSNTLTGTPQTDIFDLSAGGNDTLDLGDGNDAALFILGGWGGDTLNGGAGDQDQLGFQGISFLPLQNVTNFEEIVLFSGNVTRFGAPGNTNYSYSLTLYDENIAAGEVLKISGNGLQELESFSLNAFNETDGAVLTFGGLGTENLTGTQQSDGFYFGGGKWSTSDRVNGLTGDQDTLGLQGDYSAGVVFNSFQIRNIDIISLLSSSDTRFGGADQSAAFSYNLTMHDSNLAAGMEMAIAAARLEADETLTFDGSAELDGSFVVNSGEGDDVIIGSANGDTIQTQEGNDRITGGGGADTLRGGLGDDTFIYLDVTDSQTGSADMIVDFGDGDVIDLSAIDAILGGIDDAFTFVGSDAFSNTAGELRAENTSGNDWIIEADIDGDGVADLVIGVTREDGLQFVSGDFLL